MQRPTQQPVRRALCLKVEIEPDLVALKAMERKQDPLSDIHLDKS
jgi:hypothetical protein